MLMKVFQFYVHCFLWPLLKHQYPECPSLFCITFLSHCSMEWASSLMLASGAFRQACRNLDFSPPIVLGIGPLCAASPAKLHRFSMWIKFERFLLHHCWVVFVIRAVVPSWTRVALLLCVKSFHFTGSSVVDLQLKRGFISFSRIFVI